MPEPAVRYEIVLQAPAGDDKPLLRLRAALKALWRAYRLKAVSVVEKAGPKS